MSGNLISVTALDTTGLPEDQQFDGWARHSPNTVLKPLGGPGFLAQGRIWDMGPVLLASVELDPFTSDRTPHLVNSSPADYLQIIKLREGAVRFEANGIDQLCTAPDAFIRDYSRTSHTTSTRIRCTVIYLRRSFIAETGVEVGSQGRLPACAETSLLCAMMDQLADALGTAEASAAPFFARMVRDAVCAVLLRIGARALPAEDRDRLARIKAHIATLPPGSVSVERLVRDLGTSRSVLYSLFRDEGGVMAYDRARRLRALYRDLADPTETGSVSAIAARHGFLDKSGLARAFQNSFALSPTQVRALSRTREVSPDGGPAIEIRRKVERIQ